MSVAVTGRIRSVELHEAQGQQLRVVFLAGPSHEEPEYELLREHVLPHVTVSEISDSGSVPVLTVTNQLGIRVLLLDGQELVGAKQNRILNTGVLVPAGQRINIPVSCVEQGRWRSISKAFSPGSYASYRTRAAKSRRVYESLKARGQHDADQRAVWQEVAACATRAQVASSTGALHDVYVQRREHIARMREKLHLPPDAVGLAVFYGNTFLGLDLFDRHDTLAYFWERLLDSYCVELLDAPEPQDTAADIGAQLAKILQHVTAGKWEKFRAPGEGEDWRFSDDRCSASALTWQEKVVLHLQVFPVLSNAAASGGEVASHRPRVRRRYGPRPSSSA